jgi:hypothetical protein
MERCAVEVPKSIAEGFKRRGPRNKGHYYNLAQSALESLRYYLILCRDLKFEIDYEDLSYRVDQVGRMLDGLVRSMSRVGQEREHSGGGSSGRRRRGRRGGGGGGDRGGAARPEEMDRATEPEAMDPEARAGEPERPLGREMDDVEFPDEP